MRKQIWQRVSALEQETGNLAEPKAEPIPLNRGCNLHSKLAIIPAQKHRNSVTQEQALLGVVRQPSNLPYPWHPGGIRYSALEIDTPQRRSLLSKPSTQAHRHLSATHPPKLKYWTNPTEYRKGRARDHGFTARAVGWWKEGGKSGIHGRGRVSGEPRRYLGGSERRAAGRRAGPEPEADASGRGRGRVSIASSLHQSFLWLRPAQA